MSPVGHSLVGLAIGFSVSRPRERWAVLPALVALANLPDWPLPGWGHDAYQLSHCLLVNVVLIAVAAGVLRRWFGWRLFAAAASAWLSHLLLDSFYNHGLGIQIGWPVTDYRLNLPIPWLQTLDVASVVSWRNASVAAMELVTFGPLAFCLHLISRRDAETAEETLR